MIERFKQVTEIYAHASCPDGTASALICAKAAKVLGIKPEIHFIQYQTPEHNNLEAKPNQLFVDITPPLTRWQEWVNFNPIVLDHHKTAEIATRTLNGVFGDEKQSGALLAYEYLLYPARHAMSEREQDKLHQWEYFAKLCAIRDTWNTKDPEWYHAAATAHGLLSIGHGELLESVDTLDFDKIYQLGKLVVDKIRRKTKVIAKTAHTQIEVVNYQQCKFAFFNLTDPTLSDTAEFLRTDHGYDIVVAYFYMHGEKPCASVSFRSNDKVNVRLIAEKFGGGGHDKAAGCNMQGLPSPDTIIKQIMHAFGVYSSPINIT
jgi:oligoribonuclease NrnB/cAMP/cGMP phosphodiesterase (DHH superfamily)